jgi:alkylated DNA repair dioxygenase AlkB
VIVGISLASGARMRFRPYVAKTDRKAGIAIDLAPRSAYVMQGDIRLALAAPYTADEGAQILDHIAHCCATAGLFRHPA